MPAQLCAQAPTATRSTPCCVLDIDAELMGCCSAHGTGVPRGPAAHARTSRSLEMSCLVITHVNGTAAYGRDPDLDAADEPAQAMAVAVMEL